MQIDIRSLGPGDDEALFAACALFDYAPDQAPTRRIGSALVEARRAGARTRPLRHVDGH